LLRDTATTTDQHKYVRSYPSNPCPKFTLCAPGWSPSVIDPKRGAWQWPGVYPSLPLIRNIRVIRGSQQNRCDGWSDNDQRTTINEQRTTNNEQRATSSTDRRSPADAGTTGKFAQGGSRGRGRDGGQ